MSNASTVVRYLCGCDGLKVGQSFSNGLLVCPLHQRPVEQFEHPSPPARARFTLTLELETEAETGERLRTLTDRLELQAFGWPETIGITSSFEKLSA